MARIICRIISEIEKHQALFIVFFTLVLAGATIYLGYATRKLWKTTKDMLGVTTEALQESRRASWGTIILEANRDLFLNPRMYRVRKAIESNKPIFESKGGECTDQDIEDYIGLFDMLGGFSVHRIIDFEIMDDNFGEYVKEAYGNKEIKTYIDELRGEMKDKTLFSWFEKWAEGNLS